MLDNRIELGKCVINKTFRYVLPSLILYGKELWIKIASLSTHAVGIQDKTHNRENCIYLLVNIKGKIKYGGYLDSARGKTHFLEVLAWLKQQSFYIDDYPYNSGRNKDFHMIVLKLPIDNLALNFLDGKYSKMYTPNEVISIFPEGIEKEILLQTEKGYYYFLDYLHNEFNIGGTKSLSIEDIKHIKDIDLPPKVQEETFRWQQ